MQHNLTQTEIQLLVRDLEQQRNEAMTQCAVLNARLNVALAENQRLRDEVDTETEGVEPPKTAEKSSDGK